MAGNERYFYGSVTKPLLYEEVIRRVLEVIHDGGILPGEKFPPDRVLAAQWKTSNAVLREAFHVLAQRGIVTSIQGKGRFLRTLPDEEFRGQNIVRSLEKRSVGQLYEARNVLELHALELAVRNASGTDLDSLHSLYRKLAGRFRKTGKTTGEFELHMGYAKLSGNFYLEKMISLSLKWINEFMSSTFDEILRWHRSKEVIDAIINDHGLIIGHLRERNAGAAQAIMNEHFNRTIERLAAF
jgi:GntR family transcriptional regulator, transcriptional repressor for pyruvate dehydrogenase complex